MGEELGCLYINWWFTATCLWTLRNSFTEGTPRPVLGSVAIELLGDSLLISTSFRLHHLERKSNIRGNSRDKVVRTEWHINIVTKRCSNYNVDLLSIQVELATALVGQVSSTFFNFLLALKSLRTHRRFWDKWLYYICWDLMEDGMKNLNWYLQGSDTLRFRAIGLINYSSKHFLVPVPALF